MLHQYCWKRLIAVTVLNAADTLQVLGIVSACPETSPLHVMKLRAQQLFGARPQADDLPKDIPDLGTLGNYLLTRQVSLLMCMALMSLYLLVVLKAMRDGFLVALCCCSIRVAKCSTMWKAPD